MKDEEPITPQDEQMRSNIGHWLRWTLYACLFLAAVLTLTVIAIALGG